MISEVKHVRDRTQWHHWFAWRPVRVYAGNMYVWAWWQHVERKITQGYACHDTEYRLLK